jgi:hypothetical protein
MRSLPLIAAAAVLLLPSAMTSVQADDVSGAERMLCSIREVNFCGPGLPCAGGLPQEWNVPDFIEIDLAAKELRTTRASDQNRKTPIRSFSREDGELILTGEEQGRAFAFSIHEETGDLTVTVAGWELGGVGFGACTPLQ